jgi:hypothetical protein
MLKDAWKPPPNIRSGKTPMSFVISITTREGIVMAADSRLTLTFPDPNAPQPPIPSPSTTTASKPSMISVPQSDAQQKIFIARKRIGISTFGDAGIGPVPISGFIESFILTVTEQASPEEVAESLLAFFRNINPNLGTFFHVAGYGTKNNEPSPET